jgi:hypothetical protein
MARTSSLLALCLLSSQAFATAAPPQPVVTAPEAALRLQAAPQAERADPEQPKGQARSPRSSLTGQDRLAFVRHAQVWAPTNVSAMDLRAGPQGKGAFAPNLLVTCDHVEAKLSGTSRKFDCAVGEDDVVKVRYGADNWEVEGSVLASRLLWALGFGADRVYPVRVLCRGCSSDPWTKRDTISGEQMFDPAAIERKADGHEMKAEEGEGWAWPELNLVDEAQGGASRAQRDALTLLAVFMQHTDSKPEQQRLLCLPGGLTGDGMCDKPFMMLHDVGLTFGGANFFNRTDTGSVNLPEWAKTPVWRDAKTCVGHLSKSRTGTLGDPKIGEAGRAFLADLLVQLTDQQLRDLFEVARVDLRNRNLNSSDSARATIVDEWIAAFKRKRDEIVSNHCPG